MLELAAVIEIVHCRNAYSGETSRGYSGGKSWISFSLSGPPNNQGPPQAQRKNPSAEGPWEAAGSGVGPSHPLGLLDETPQKAKTK